MRACACVRARARARVCVCVCVFVCVCVSLSFWLNVYYPAGAGALLHVLVRVYVCVNARVYTGVPVRVYARTCVCLYVRVHVLERLHAETILRATLLTKDIYMRAHRHRLTGPTTRSLSRPEMSLPSLYDQIRAAYDEERLAQQSLRSAQQLKRWVS